MDWEPRRYTPVDDGAVAPDDVSVIIQGPLFIGSQDRPDIRACLAALAASLPGAEIIVVTWRGEKIGKVVADHVVTLPEAESSAWDVRPIRLPASLA